MTDPLAYWEGEPLRVWELVWRVPRLEVWESLASTNDRALELARGGAPPFTLVIADEQTVGRGRSGRRWWSPAGAGLWLSLVVRGGRRGPDPLLPLLAGVATARAVEAVSGLRTRVKWPNDVWVGERKVAGVLCEAALGGTVVGVGVNVLQAPKDFPRELRGQASSLAAEAGKPVSRAELVGALLRAARTLLAQSSELLAGDLAREVRDRDLLRGRRLSVGAVRGIGAGVAPDGRLRIEVSPGRVVLIAAGHVRVEGSGGATAGGAD